MSAPFVRSVSRYIDVRFDEIKTILDIGSRDALSSVDFARLFPDASIYAFEANPEAFAQCLDNSRSYPNIKCINKAVYKENTNITFRPMDLEKSRDKNIGASSMFEVDPTVRLPNDWSWVQKEISVEAVTLDSWRETNGIGPVDFIWMDVQGSEGFVLQGARNTLKDVRALITEAGMTPYYKGQTLLPEINDFLVKNGFCLIEFWPEMPLECTTLYVNKRFLRKPIPDLSV